MRYLLPIAFLLAVSFASFAQSGVRLGVQGGYGYTEMLGRSPVKGGYYNKPNSFAENAGIHVMLPVSKQLGVRLEMNVSTLTQRYASGVDYRNQPYQTSVTDRLQYLDVPLLLQYRHKFLYAEAGPQLSFLRKATADKLEDGRARRYDITNNFNKHSMSGVLGLGVELGLTKNKDLMLNTGVRCSYVCTDITYPMDKNEAGPEKSLTAVNANLDGYTPTYALSCRVHLGLSYAVPCKKKAKKK